MTSVVLDIMLGSLIWLGGGYLCGDFIIRWNQRHLAKYPIESEKLLVADRLNADLHLRDGTEISKWRILLTLMGPVTIPKAALLRLCGGRA